ncbi:hypothetical protein, variant [Aphanomyces invadans]|uniref:Uncharacterized protein n=1 Tax=Aphanomyces invadans TaxID=157072 RepID=A0A024TNR1_9STRA|nr:hypothetical protein, variant [Aphanomyces invadans]ETV95649.1 hypothetical protein, variant [Aphanomyces invadans]|eukprot:XP_008875842.1 hypothetical protein, variant [Aphanomyces invadans]
MDDRRVRTVEGAARSPRVSIKAVNTETPADPLAPGAALDAVNSTTTTDNDSIASPKSVMSSPNLTGGIASSAVRRDSPSPFKLSNLLHFKDDKKSTEDRSAEVAGLTAADAIAGTLSMHLKDPDKKKLFYVKTKYRVVVCANRPTMDLFTSHNSDASPAYMLSLCKSSLVHDPKAAADGTFALHVHAWTKQATVHYRPQLFVFHDEKHHRVEAWIACLQRAIAASADMDEGHVLAAGLADALSTCVDEEVDDRPSSYVDSESAMSASSGSDNDDDDVGEAVARTLKKLNPFSPKASCAPATSLESQHRASTSDSKPPMNPSTPQNPLGRFNRAFQAKKPPPLDKATSHPVLSLEERCELLRQHNFDKVQDKHPSDHARPDAASNVSDAVPPPVIRPRESKPHSSATTYPSYRQLLRKARAVLLHPSGGMGLVLSFTSGYGNASVLCPLALAGFYAAQLPTHNSDEPTLVLGYPGLVAAFVVVHVMASSGSIAGGLAVAFVVMLLAHSTTLEAKRQHLRSDMRQLTMAEKSNFANCPTVEFPSWVKFPDVERAEWLNTAIARSWPYVKVAIKNSVMYYVNPMLETNTPAMLTSMVLTDLDMGDTPPSFGGIKCIPDDSMLARGPVTEVSFDAEVRFVAGDDQLAELKLISHMGGATARVRLKDAVIMGTMRITLRPMASVWPGFSGISLSFISPPRIDFSLTAAKIAITSVPFASDWLQTFILDIVTNNLVWPKVLDIPFWDPALYPVEGVDDLPLRSPSTQGPSTQTSDEKRSVFGPGVVSLHVRKLTVLSPTTTALPAESIAVLTAAEIYCIVMLGQSHKTEIRVIDGHGLCTLDEKYEFYWDSVAAPTLQVEVWQHQRAVPDQALGTATVPLGSLAAKRDHELQVNVELGDGVRGILHVHVCRRLFSTVQVARSVTSQPKKSQIEGLGHDVCVGMLFVTWVSVMWANEDDARAIHGVFTCEKQRANSTTQAKVKASTWQELYGTCSVEEGS